MEVWKKKTKNESRKGLDIYPLDIKIQTLVKNISFAHTDAGYHERMKVVDIQLF